jgi:nucleotide-binding universal stress UspA family protein
MMSGVVVGYVASPEGEAAVRQGIAEAKLRGTMVVVVYSDHGEKLDSATAVERTEALDRVHALLHSAEVEHDLRHLVRGKDPVADVLETADELGADLIVIGIRRRTPVGKLVLGSNSQSILLEATIPVLAVKA